MSEKLQFKIRTYKKQVEDAEEIAALNLAKFRKAQSEMEEADQRANLSEQALSKLRAKSIMSTSSGDMVRLVIFLKLCMSVCPQYIF